MTIDHWRPSALAVLHAVCAAAASSVVLHASSVKLGSIPARNVEFKIVDNAPIIGGPRP